MEIFWSYGFCTLEIETSTRFKKNNSANTFWRYDFFALAIHLIHEDLQLHSTKTISMIYIQYEIIRDYFKKY